MLPTLLGLVLCLSQQSEANSVRLWGGAASINLPKAVEITKEGKNAYLVCPSGDEGAVLRLERNFLSKKSRDSSSSKLVKDEVVRLRSLGYLVESSKVGKGGAHIQFSGTVIEDESAEDFRARVSAPCATFPWSRATSGAPRPGGIASWIQGIPPGGGKQDPGDGAQRRRSRHRRSPLFPRFSFSAFPSGSPLPPQFKEKGLTPLTLPSRKQKPRTLRERRLPQRGESRADLRSQAVLLRDECGQDRHSFQHLGQGR